MKSFYLFLSIFLLSSSVLYSQHILKGHILDQKSHKNLDAVVVQITNIDSTLYATTYTQHDGKFEVNIPIEEFSISIKNLGYNDYSAQIGKQHPNTIDLGDILLHKKDIKLNEITITSDRLQEKGTKTLAFPTKVQQSNSTSAVDLIKHLQLPSLYYDALSGEIQILGTSKVQYRINGMNASPEQIKSLEAKEIDHIEYSRVPTMRELNQDAGVLNIITTKSKLGTYLYIDWFNGFNFGLIQNTLNFRTVFGKSQLSINYNVKWVNTQQMQESNTEYYYTPTDTTCWEMNAQNALLKYNRHNLYTEYLYSDSINSVSAKLLYTYYKPTQKHFYHTIDPQKNTHLFDRDYSVNGKSDIPKLDIYYIHNFDPKKRVEMNLVSSVNMENNTSTLCDVYNQKESCIQNSQDQIDPSIYYEALYSQPIHSQTMLEVGFQQQYQFSSIQFDNNGTQDTSKVHWLDLYPYANIQGTLSPHLSYTLGSGIKYSYSNNKVSKMNFCRNLTTATLFYKRDTWSLRNTLRYTPSYPELASLNNISIQQDTLNTSRGNPYTKPSSTLKNDLFYTQTLWKKIHVVSNVSISKTNKPIYNDYYYDRDIESFVTQINNQQYERNLELGINASWSSIFKIFDIQYMLYWDKFWEEGNYYSYTFDTYNWILNIAAYYKQFKATFNYRSKVQNAMGPLLWQKDKRSSLDLQYKIKNFFAGINIFYMGVDGEYHETQTISDVMPKQHQELAKDTRNAVLLHITYTFSNGKPIIDLDKKI